MSWGHVINYSNGTLSSAYRAEILANETHSQSPTYAYDVSNVTSDPISKQLVDYGNVYSKSAVTRAIKDIEVVGDYMYVVIIAGIEVISLAPPKADDATTATTLTKSTTLTKAGDVMDLEIVGSLLYAGYAGAEVYEAVETEPHGDGALVVYDISNPATPAEIKSQTITYGVVDVTINEAAGKIYVFSDSKTSPVLETYNYDNAQISLVPASAQGKYDVKVNVVNPDSVSGIMICAIYDDEGLVKAVVSPAGIYSGVTTVASNCGIGADVEKVKIMFLDSMATMRPLAFAIFI